MLNAHAAYYNRNMTKSRCIKVPVLVETIGRVKTHEIFDINFRKLEQIYGFFREHKFSVFALFRVFKYINFREKAQKSQQKFLFTAV